MVKIKDRKGVDDEGVSKKINSDRCKNIKMLAKVQPFCIIFGLDIGVYKLNSKKILPQKMNGKIVFCLHTKTTSVWYRILCDMELK